MTSYHIVFGELTELSAQISMSVLLRCFDYNGKHMNHRLISHEAAHVTLALWYISQCRKYVSLET